MSTIVEQQQTIATNMKERVCQMLEMSHDAYCQLQYEEGLAYLTLNYRNTPTRDALESSRIFWAWWRKTWCEEDANFLHDMKHGSRPLGLVAMRVLYQSYQSAKEKVCSLTLPSSVLEACNIKTVHYAIQ